MGKKDEHFKRIAGNRLAKIIQLINQLSNLSNSSYYEYSESDVNKIIESIEDELRLTKDKLLNSRALKEEIIDCSFKSILESYKISYRKYGNESIVHSLAGVFETVNWRVSRNKTMQNTFELIEFAFAHCEYLDGEAFHAYYVYKRLKDLEDILKYEYKKIEDDSNLMNRVKKGMNKIRRITSLSKEEFYENPQNALEVYVIILECFDAIKAQDYVYRLLIGIVNTQIWRYTPDIGQEYYSILEKTVSEWDDDLKRI